MEAGDKMKVCDHPAMYVIMLSDLTMATDLLIGWAHTKERARVMVRERNIEVISCHGAPKAGSPLPLYYLERCK